jgi:TatD DNase family protein
LFDSHCHPTDIEDPLGVIRAAVHAGLHSLLACGYNMQSNRKVEELRDSVPSLPVAVGLHPWYSNESIDAIREQVLRTLPVAIGECGLDAADDPTIPPITTQCRAFEAQLALAMEMSLPVTVHSRRAVSMVHDIVANFGGVRGVMHAYSGSYEQAKSFLMRGWLIGIGGTVTRERSERIRRLVTQLPLSGIALETDAPAIGIRDVPPPHVRPAHLPRIVQEIAILRGISSDEVIAATNANVEDLFGVRVRQSLEVC